ncbi:hypothetical protein [Sphingosinithalassobacter sp. CS137]|uniref:hypothetical protein n=1 Tax=Sphingosinithalassobacter sp. CS137 TaxID=2762748 RepID=UPI00165E6F0F|nr:hypothetical protein [Sphingosinithalassobacter sp. CS137]
MIRSAPPRWAWSIVLLATAAAAALGFVAPPLSGWRQAVTVIAGLGGGSVLLAMIGRLLGREWLEVLEDELLPGGALLLLAAVLALPFLSVAAPDPGTLFGSEGLTPQRAWWFAPGAMALRLVLFVAAGAALAAAMTWWTRARRKISALGLPAFGALFALAAIDWIVMRAPLWWTALQPIGFVVNQLTGALALAFVFNIVQREKTDHAALASVAAALLTLALLGLWIGFVQYLVAWYGNLPAAAAWYQVRGGALPWLLPAAIGLQITGVLVLLARRSKRTMLGASVALLGAYLLHGLWIAGPMLPDGPADWAVFAGLLVLAACWLALLARWYDAKIVSRERTEGPQ